MTVAQCEHSRTFDEPAPPAQNRFDKLFELLRDRNSDIIVVRTRRMQIRDHDSRSWEIEAQASDRRKLLADQMAQAEKRCAKVEIQIDDFIVEAAEAIKAERAELGNTL